MTFTQDEFSAHFVWLFGVDPFEIGPRYSLTHCRCQLYNTTKNDAILYRFSTLNNTMNNNKEDRTLKARQ